MFSYKTVTYMSFTADELVKWRDAPDWFDRIDIDEYEGLAGIGYRPEHITMYYKKTEAEFLWDFKLVGNPLKYN